jgi:NMD protein affecting ribosome stability and mRNA decay
MGGRKSNKKYTNEAWTKRVDHEAGRHRTPRAPAEALVCEVCGYIYTNRRWITPSVFKVKQKPTSIDFSTRQWVAAEKQKSREALSSHAAETVVCPSCQRQREGVPSGFLHLDGVFLTHHREEIERLLNNEAERVAEDNPVARIMKWGQDEKGRLMLTTTTEHLAQRLGRSLQKAFKGKVRYDFSHENKLAHVYWSRN